MPIDALVRPYSIEHHMGIVSLTTHAGITVRCLDMMDVPKTVTRQATS
jgi:hypothetical protein